MVELTLDQERALDRIKMWYRGRDKRYFTLGGYAGTGKTIVIAQLQREIPDARIRYCAFTAKAAAVLRDSLRDAGIEVESTATRRNGESYRVKHVTTVHGLIKVHREIVYCLRTGTTLRDSNWDLARNRERCGACGSGAPCPTRTETKWERRPNESLTGVNLIVLDEASMIGESLWTDLLAYNIPILAVGDHGQLPPVGENAFNLMAESRLDIQLKKIHRQAEDSAIIRMARLARTTGQIPYGVMSGRADEFVAKFAYNDMNELIINFDNDLALLCGRNVTRVAWNEAIRSRCGRTGPVQVGDRITCLRNSLSTYNGMMGTVTQVAGAGNGGVELGVRVDGADDDEDDLRIRAVSDQFGRDTKMSYDEMRARRLTGLGLWDFGYALTVHKAQGSSIDRVIVMEERLPGGVENHRRWLYTAVTRARKKLLIVA